MSVLLRAAELVKLPVVTLAGFEVALIKDVIYSSATGELAGFTLNGTGLFSGPLRKTLPWPNVHGLGPAAVMIKDEESLADRTALKGEREGAGGAVLGSTVITQGGRSLGEVTDVILSVGDGVTDAVGYEIRPLDESAPRHQFVPLPDTLSVSGEALIVPESAIHFIRDDLAGFGAAVDEFRRQLHTQAAAGDAAHSAPASPPVASPPDITRQAPSTEPPRDLRVEPGRDTRPFQPVEPGAPPPSPPAPQEGVQR